MGKSVRLRLVGGKEPRQLMWEAIRDRRESFSGEEVAQSTEQELGTVMAYIRAMGKAKIIKALDRAARDKQRWALILDEGLEHPRLNVRGQRHVHGQALENLWRTLRIMGELTAAEAAEVSSVGGVRVTQSYATNYYSTLARAGYVIARSYDHQRAVTYRLAPNGYTGPRHPVVQRHESIQVFDPNKDEVVFSRRLAGGVPVESEPTNDMQQENLRMRALLTELMEQRGVTSTGLLQRIQLELAE